MHRGPVTRVFLVLATVASVFQLTAAGRPAAAAEPAEPGREVLRFDRPAYGTDTCVALRLEASGRNTDPLEPERVAATVHARASGDAEEIVLQEDEPDTGTFTGLACAPLSVDDKGAAKAGDEMLLARSGDFLVAFLSDAEKQPGALDTALVLGGAPEGRVQIAVDPALVPKDVAAAGAAAVVDPDGALAFFADDQVLFRPASQADLDEFVARRNGTVLGKVEMPVDDGKTTGQWYVVQIGIISPEEEAGFSDPDFARLLELADQKAQGTYTYSSAQAAELMHAVLVEQLAGAAVAPNALLQYQSSPVTNEGAAGNFFAQPWYGADPITDGVTTKQALAVQEIADHTSPVRVAIVDGGFPNAAQNGGTDNRDYGLPFDSIPQCDVNGFGGTNCGPGAAAGMAPLPCSGDNPCPWHGLQMFSTAGAEMNNGFGAVGSGAQAVDPMFMRIGYPYVIPAAAAIRTAADMGATVINLSSGVPCRPFVVDLCNAWEVGGLVLSGALPLLCAVVADIVPGAGPLACPIIIGLILSIPGQFGLLAAAVDYAESRQVVITSSAGNTASVAGQTFGPFDVNDSKIIPCVLGQVVCVGNLAFTGSDVTAAGDSFFGSMVDIWSPGTAVMTTPLPGMTGLSRADGTSPAAAFTAGVVAQIRAINPSLSAAGARAILFASRCSPSNRTRLGRLDCVPSSNGSVNTGGGYVDVLEAVKRARQSAGRSTLGSCTGGWDELTGDSPATPIVMAPEPAPGSRSDAGADRSVHALASDDDWYRFRPPVDTTSTRLRIDLATLDASIGTLEMNVYRTRPGVPTDVRDANRVFQSATTGGTASLDASFIRDGEYYVKVGAVSPALTNDNCYSLVITTVGAGPAADRFEGAGRPQLSSWSHRHHDPRLRVTDEVWTMRVDGLSIHGPFDDDVFDVMLPDPGGAPDGHPDVHRDYPVAGPLPECGYYEDFGSSVHTSGFLTARAFPVGQTSGDQLLILNGDPNSITGSGFTTRMSCPHTGNLSVVQLGVGQRGYYSSDRAFAFTYSLEIEYKIHIVRGMPQWALDAEALEHAFVGGFPCPGGYVPGCIGGQFSHPINPLCLVDGCGDMLVIGWNAKHDFDMALPSDTPLTFVLYDENHKARARAPVPMKVVNDESGGTQRLFVPGLDPGLYVLEVTGPAAEYEVGFEPPDSDGDGVLDALDVCPLQAEDADGYLDTDGCLDVPVTTRTAVASEPAYDGWTHGSWTVELACEGCVRTEYRINGDPVGAYTRPIVLDTDGEWAIAFRSVDKLGNAEEFTTVTLGIDRTPPSAQMRTGDPAVFVPPATKVDLRAVAADIGSGVASVCFRVSDGGACTPAVTGADGLWHASPDLATGIYDVQAVVTDVVGNSQASGTVRVVVARIA